MKSTMGEYIARRCGFPGTLTREKLRAWQDARIAEAREYAASRSRFYAESREFTTREDILRDPTAFLCVNPKEVARVMTLATSGTSGARKRLFFTEEDIGLTREFFASGMAHIVGAGETAAVFMPGEGEYTVGGLLRSALASYGAAARVYGFFDGTDGAISFASDAIVGLPAEMLRLCRIAPHLRPKAVLLSGDEATIAIRRAIGRAWGARVFSHYGATEACYGLAVETDAHDGLAIRSSDMRIEVIDPATLEAVQDGDEGELVLTTFAHRAAPLFRYRTGDRGRLMPGGTLERLSPDITRAEAAVTLKNGRTLTLAALDEAVLAHEGVIDYSASVRGDAALEVTIEGEADGAKLRARLEDSLGVRAAVIRGKTSRKPGQKRKIHKLP